MQINQQTTNIILGIYDWHRSPKYDAPGVTTYTNEKFDQMAAIPNDGDRWVCVHNRADPGGQDASDWEDEWCEVPEEIEFDRFILSLGRK